MRNKLSRKVTFLFLLCFFISAYVFIISSKKIPIRIGYALLTPIHCHIGEVFLRTDILKKQRLDAKLIPFLRGYEQAEAVEKGEIDVVFGSEVPAVLTLSKNPYMRIVGTPGQLGRNVLLVPADSSISGVAQLKGKKVGLTAGSTSHKDFLKWIKAESIALEDIFVVDLSQEQIEEALSRKMIDAAVMWDPWAEVLIRKQKTKIISQRLFWSLILSSQRYIDKYPHGIPRYLRAVKKAVCFTLRNRDKVNCWVMEKSQWPLDIVEFIIQYNSNFSGNIKQCNLKLSLTNEVKQALEECVVFLKQSNSVPQNFNLDKYIINF